MGVRGRRRGRVVFIAAMLLALYSFVTFAFFLTMKGSPKEKNNQSAVKDLQANEGMYFSFVVLGDNHSGLVFNDSAAINEIWHMNREERFRKAPVDFVLNVGDVTLSGKREHFESYKKIQKLIKFPVISALGNHDDRALFEEYCGATEFSFSDRNSFFIVVDNEKGNVSESQFSWFEDELKKGKKYDHIFVVLHKPPFDPYQQDWYRASPEPWTGRFRELCSKYGVDIVFSGHKHMFKHENFGGVDYIVTGGGGMLIEIPEKDGGYLHYVRVVVNGKNVSYEVRKISPPFWEVITYYMWKEAVYWVRNLYGSGIIPGAREIPAAQVVPDANDREY